MLEKYGVEHAAQSDIIKDKMKQTCLERYGVENIMSCDEFKDKIKQTSLEMIWCRTHLTDTII